jgi:hypothetical protein
MVLGRDIGVLLKIAFNCNLHVLVVRDLTLIKARRIRGATGIAAPMVPCYVAIQTEICARRKGYPP